MLPTFWFRNTWDSPEASDRPLLSQLAPGADGSVISAAHADLGERFVYSEDAAELLFTENETNTERIAGTPNRTPYVKDGVNDYIVHGRTDAVNPRRLGTKAAVHYSITVGAGQSHVIRLRLSDIAPGEFAKATSASSEPFGAGFGAVMAARRREADEFYASVIPATLSADAANVMRQALAGMLWSKQFYLLRHREVAQGTRRGATGRAAKRALAPHVQRRHHLDAGQVGVSVVRGLGSRLPYLCADARR